MENGTRLFLLRTHSAALESPGVVGLGGKEYPKRRTHERHLRWFPRAWRVNPGSVTWTHALHDPALAPFPMFHLWPLPVSHASLQQIFQLILFSQCNLPTQRGVSSSSFLHVVPVDVIMFLLHWPFRVQLEPPIRRSTSIPKSDFCVPPLGPYSTLSYTSIIS